MVGRIAGTLPRPERWVRFGLEINGERIDRTRYRIARQSLRDGRHCGWVGVAAGVIRASINRFVYEVEHAGGQSVLAR